MAVPRISPVFLTPLARVGSFTGRSAVLTLTPPPPVPFTYNFPNAFALPTVSIYSSYWPYQRIAILKTAASTTRSYMKMDKGQAQTMISKSDPALVGRPGVLQKGNFLVIESPYVDTWAGPIGLLDETIGSGLLQVSATGIAGVLEIRNTYANAKYDKIASGTIFQDLVRQTNARGHIGLFMPNLVDPGPSVSEDYTGLHISEALADLNKKTNYEWGVDPLIYKGQLRTQISWFYQQGFVREDVVLYEGTHFVDVAHTFDTSQIRQLVQIVGGSGTISITDRTIITRGNTPTASDMGGLDVEPTSELYRRAADVPPTLRGESIIYRPSMSDRTQLSLQAANAQELPLATAERVKLTINNKVSWRKLKLGNYIRVRIYSLSTGPIDRIIRIVGLQPTEETGTCNLLVEFPSFGLDESAA